MGEGPSRRTREYRKLPLEAQRNCDADALAGTFYQHMPQPMHTEAPLASNPVQLFLGNASVTRRYRDHIRTAATLQPLQQYLCKRFKWDPGRLTEVAWDSFTSITNSHRTQRTTIVKHVHGIAPTGHIAHRNSTCYDAGCPSCECDREDNNHLLICPAASREAWRNQTFIGIATVKRDNSDPVLKRILQAGLRSIQDNPDGVCPLEHPHEYRMLIEQQNALGWDQLYRGRWSKLWSQLHQSYSRQQVNWDKEDKDGKRWVEIHGKKLLQQWLLLWELRNKERHGVDQEAQNRQRLSLLTTQLTTLYELRSQVMPRDRRLFYSNVNEHIAARPDLNLMEDWILTHRTAIKASAKQAQQQGINRHHTIDEYFLRRNNNSTDTEPQVRTREPQ